MSFRTYGLGVILNSIRTSEQAMQFEEDFAISETIVHISKQLELAILT